MAAAAVPPGEWLGAGWRLESLGFQCWAERRKTGGEEWGGEGEFGGGIWGRGMEEEFQI